MTDTEQARFDSLLEQVLKSLPEPLSSLLIDTPLIVDDQPDSQLTDELGLDDPAELCGLHTGQALTERSVEDPTRFPDEIRLFRLGIVLLAGGWDRTGADERVREEIRITLLHEIGHHFGLDEDDLADLGYA